MSNERCSTPGAKYHIKIGPNVVECKVDIPFDLSLDREKAVKLENQVHNAMQSILTSYWWRVDTSHIGA